MGVFGAPVGTVAAVELTATPNPLKLAPDESAELVVTAQNDEGTPASGLRLQTYPREDLSIEAKAVPGQDAILAAGGSVSWLFEVSRQPSGERSTPLLLRLAFSQAPEEGKPAVGREAVVAVTIEAASHTALTARAGLELRSALEVLKDRRRANAVHLVISNKGTEPLAVGGIRVFAPYFLCVDRGTWRQDDCESGENAGQTEETFDPPLDLAAGSSRVVPYVLTASAVEPGKHTLQWEVDFVWSAGARRSEGTLVAHKDIQFGVLGESEFVTGLKIPSLFLLPGFLFLLTLGSLRKWVHPKVEKVLDLEAVEVLFAAATISVIAALTYPWLTKSLFKDPRDFIVLAGFEDITNLWIAAVFLGLAAWALWYGGGSLVRRAVRAYRDGRERASLPQPQDKPLVVLQKLQRAGRQKLGFPEAELKREGGGEASRGLIVFDYGESIWLVPPIDVSGGSASGRDAVRDAIDGGVATLIESLGKGADAPSLEWAGEPGLISGPLKVPTGGDKIPRGGEQRLVRLV